MEKQSSPFGLIGWLEQTRVVLPLKGVECQFVVCGDLLNVELDQIFEQNNRQPLDCDYVFPLPAGAAVYRCEMHVNGRVIRARVEEAERARELVREKKEAGFRTALVEMERDNLFTLSLGNVQPGDLIVIRLAYFQLVRRLEDWVSFHIPFCPGVRYIPGKPLLRAPSGRGTADDTDQVPDASRISPPRMDRLHPDAAYISVDGRIEDGSEVVTDVSSPSHPVLLRDGEACFSVALAAGDSVPDRDFVLRWTERPAPTLSAKGWVWRGPEHSYALVRLQAPPAKALEERGGHDVYFLLDRSGSMAGLKWQQTARAFGEFVRRLHPEDRVWLTLFESGFRDFAEKPLPARTVLADPAAQRLESLGTNGGTELLPALHHVIEKISQHSVERPTTLLLITDGQVGNETEILTDLRRHPNLCVHTFGIDVAINDGLLQRMAEQQRGTSWLLSPQDDIVGAVARMAGQLRAPVATALHSSPEWSPPELRRIDLHSGESLVLCLRGPAHGMALEIGGTRSDGKSCRWPIELREIQDPAASLWWARRHMDELIQRGRTAEAIALARADNLICPGASFVAWDEAEKVVVSREHLQQPVMEAHFSLRDFSGLREMNMGERRRGAFIRRDRMMGGSVRMRSSTREPLSGGSVGGIREPLGSVEPQSPVPPTESLWQMILRSILEVKHGVDLPHNAPMRDRLLKVLRRLRNLGAYASVARVEQLVDALARWCAWDDSKPVLLELSVLERRVSQLEILVEQFDFARDGGDRVVKVVQQWMDCQHAEDRSSLEPLRQWIRDLEPYR